LLTWGEGMYVKIWDISSGKPEGFIQHAAEGAASTEILKTNPETQLTIGISPISETASLVSAIVEARLSEMTIKSLEL